MILGHRPFPTEGGGREEGRKGGREEGRKGGREGGAAKKWGTFLPSSLPLATVSSFFLLPSSFFLLLKTYKLLGNKTFANLVTNSS
jgi:hypothetical protein